MTVPKAALVWCPFPDRDSAHEAAAQMLEAKLIACANILPAIESVFEWEGAASSTGETAVLFKTTSDKLADLVDCLGEAHPYDTPAILGWRCDEAHPATLKWLEETLLTETTGLAKDA